jgi:transposase
VQSGWYDRRERRARDLSSGPFRIYLPFDIRRLHCRRCGTVKREGLDWLGDNPFYTRRFATYVGRRCRSETIKVRKAEYARLDGRSRTFIKGQKYALLSHPQNLKNPARKNLKLLLAANKRLYTGYPLKEPFGQLWDYSSEAWARKFFDNWRAQLKWQRLAPYERFADMSERHWDGIAAYCRPENKVSLGFVERLNNKIRVLQRRAYGLRDEEYLRRKVLTCMLPKH